MKQLLILCAISLLTVTGTMHAFSAEKSVTWNAAQAQAQTDNLLDAAQKLVRECRTSPPNYSEVATSNTHLEFLYHVRHFRSVAAELSMALENGKGRDWTAPMYDELVDIMPDLKKYAIDNPRGAWVAVERAVIEADNALKELGTSYAN